MRAPYLVLLAAAAAAADVSQPSRSVAPERLRLERVLTGGDDFVFASAISGDGRLVAAGRRDGRIARWDLAGGEALPPLAGHEGYAHAVAFSPSARSLVSGGADGTVRTWDFASGRESAVLRGHLGSVHAVAFADGGRAVVSGGADGARVWNLERRETRHVLAHGAAVLAVAAAHDTVLTGGADGLVRLWSLRSGAARRTIEAGPRAITSVALASDGRLATGSLDGRVRVWSAAGEAPRLALECGGPVRAVAFSPDGRTLAAATAAGTRYWDAGGALRASNDGGAAATGIAFAGAGAAVVETFANNRVCVRGARGGAGAPDAAPRARGFLGVTYQNEGGALVGSVIAGSQAESVGLAANDVIVGADGVDVATSDDFLGFMRAAFEGDEVTLRVRREGREMIIRAKLGRVP